MTKTFVALIVALGLSTTAYAKTAKKAKVTSKSPGKTMVFDLAGIDVKSSKKAILEMERTAKKLPGVRAAFVAKRKGLLTLKVKKSMTRSELESALLAAKIPLKNKEPAPAAESSEDKSAADKDVESEPGEEIDITDKDLE